MTHSLPQAIEHLNVNRYYPLVPLQRAFVTKMVRSISTVVAMTIYQLEIKWPPISLTIQYRMQRKTLLSTKMLQIRTVTLTVVLSVLRRRQQGTKWATVRVNSCSKIGNLFLPLLTTQTNIAIVIYNSYSLAARISPTTSTCTIAYRLQYCSNSTLSTCTNMGYLETSTHVEGARCRPIIHENELSTSRTPFNILESIGR